MRGTRGGGQITCAELAWRRTRALPKAASRRARLSRWVDREWRERLRGRRRRRRRVPLLVWRNVLGRCNVRAATRKGGAGRLCVCVRVRARRVLRVCSRLGLPQSAAERGTRIHTRTHASRGRGRSQCAATGQGASTRAVCGLGEMFGASRVGGVARAEPTRTEGYVCACVSRDDHGGMARWCRCRRRPPPTSRRPHAHRSQCVRCRRARGYAATRVCVLMCDGCVSMRRGHESATTRRAYDA